MKDETRGTFQLAIMRRAHVRKSQKGLPTGRSGERIHCKEVRRVAIDVTDAQKPVFPQLLFHRDIPCEVAWCRVQLAWQTAGCQRVRSANIDIGVGHGEPTLQARCIERRNHLSRVGCEVSGKKRQQTVEQANARPNYGLALIAWGISHTGARSHRRGPAICFARQTGPQI